MKPPESPMSCKGVRIDIDMIEETRSSNLTLQVSHSFGQNENGRGKKKTKYATDLEMSPKYFLNTERKSQPRTIPWVAIRRLWSLNHGRYNRPQAPMLMAVVNQHSR
ncbi:hypothetical protein FBULB1_10708 [Fusarium bulbicola]|nr:hypothetical protein FBULB1_10708 [Fusarium bulbicola]